MVELSFHLPGISGNPFDYTQNDVRLILNGPSGRDEAALAFYDGGDTWRVRFTPHAPGNYAVKRVDNNAKSVSGVSVEPAEFAASRAVPGFVRRSNRSPLQFEIDGGERYYPLGNDTAWSAGPGQDVTDVFENMAKAGENWSRVWMCHWDGKNLDWPRSSNSPLGTLNLGAARKWDVIVSAAARLGIRFQMTLQHHGQYSTMVDPNWNDNPWNERNGGFLPSPIAFFTNTRALALTRAKYRYILARYGWSPAIMAWELFNEVEGTDAARTKQYPAIENWHRSMASFIRSQDPYHHLITTSSDTSIAGLFDSMDYVQPHSYSPDPLAVIAGIHPSAAGKPIFLGEIGPSGNKPNDTDFLRSILWASIMSDCSGSAQYWYWDRMSAQNLFKEYASVSEFLRRSGQTTHFDLKPVRTIVQTASLGTYSFGAGGGWNKAERTRFTVDPDSALEGAGSIPTYFQGSAHRDMFPELELAVNYSHPGTFSVTVGSVAKSGAGLVIMIDGKSASEKVFPGAPKDTEINQEVSVPVAAGKHVITLRNPGADWFTLSRVSLKPYGSALRALATCSEDYAGVWVNRQELGTTPVVGVVDFIGLAPGSYEVTWWDIARGTAISHAPVRVGLDRHVSIHTPPVSVSVAAYVRRK